jgi:MFS family permease
MGFCYFLYSAGVVVGLWATPAIATPFGWPAVFALYSALGIAWAVSLTPPPRVARVSLPYTPPPPLSPTPLPLRISGFEPAAATGFDPAAATPFEWPAVLKPVTAAYCVKYAVAYIWYVMAYLLQKTRNIVHEGGISHATLPR